MKQFFESERLIFTDFSIEEDTKTFYDYRSDSMVSRYQGFRPNGVEDAEKFLLRLETFQVPISVLSPGWYQLAIRRKDSVQESSSCSSSGPLIGDIGVHLFDDDDSSVELGITLAKEVQKEGLATEAFRTIINHVFSETSISTVVCSIDPRNESCLKLLQKLGFQVHRIDKDAFTLHDEIVDDMILQLKKLDLIK